MESDLNGSYGDLGRRGRVRAPALPPRPEAWINHPPVDLRQLRGRPVLLDFWTGGCINCVHVAREIEALQARCPALQVIGIHTPKFEREAHPAQVRAAIDRLGLTHPVYNDAEGYLRDQYTIRAWPTLVLLDGQGRIVRQVAGEGQAEALAALIDALLHGQSLPPAEWEVAPAPARFWRAPQKLTADPAGGWFVADSGHHRLLAFSQEGELIAQAGDGLAGLTDGPAAEARLHQPMGLAYHAAQQRLYFADSGNHALRCWDLRTQRVHTLAGDGQQGRGYRPGWQGLQARLNAPWDLAWHQDWLYLACAGSHQLWRYRPTDGQLETVLGTGEENLVDGPPQQALLGQPMALASDGQHLYWLDAEGSALRRWDGQRAETLVGTGLFAFGSADGPYPEAQMQHPQGLACHAGQLWIADTYNGALRRYDPAQQELHTVATGFTEPVDLAWVGERLWVLDGQVWEKRGENWKVAGLFTCEEDRCVMIGA